MLELRQLYSWALNALPVIYYDKWEKWVTGKDCRKRAVKPSEALICSDHRTSFDRCPNANPMQYFIEDDQLVSGIRSIRLIQCDSSRFLKDEASELVDFTSIRVNPTGVMSFEER